MSSASVRLTKAARPSSVLGAVQWKEIYVETPPEEPPQGKFGDAAAGDLFELRDKVASFGTGDPFSNQ